jgi:hypothetical protein
LAALWNISKALHVPLDSQLTQLTDIPYTMSYVIRKRQQIDSFNELTEDKRPPESIVWDGTNEEIDSWIKSVIKHERNPNTSLVITEDEIER